MNTVDMIYDYFKDLNELGGIRRQGNLFKTESQNYYYDTGTGKIVHCSEDEYNLLDWAFNKGNKEELEKLNQITLEEAFDNIKHVIDQEHILQLPIIELFNPYLDSEFYSSTIDNCMKQIILEVTEECNLRCNYCIYNDEFDKKRSFTHRHMSIEVMQAAIDYQYKRTKPGDEIVITFYGGEPLLRFDFIKEVEKYAQKTMIDRNIGYSMTTNGTLVTDEIADFITNHKNFHITFSIDGPEEIHNANRKQINGKGSFDKAINGLRLLMSYYNKKDAYNGQVLINSVCTPPYTEEKAQQMQDFYDSLDWLPRSVPKMLANPTYGTIPEHKTDTLKEVNGNNIAKYRNPMQNWGLRNMFSNIDNKKRINEMVTKYAFDDALLRIHNRQIFDEPNTIINLNGCCNPGEKKIYVTTQGKIMICERIDDTFPLGNIFDDVIDIDVVMDKYVNEYMEKSIHNCSKCWAVRLCKMCYIHSYDKNGFNTEIKDFHCVGERNSILSAMVLYHEIYDQNPSALEYLNNIEIG